MSNLIQVDLQNYVRSIKLKDSQYLFPLYEVVVNSIQAIHELNAGLGKIDIYIRRDVGKQLSLDATVETLPEIVDFEVVDNGIGFNEINRNSFSVAFTGHKASIGCKGVGRFLALAAFKNIQVDSIFSIL
jgi:nitrogen-specific signal transduction histidine kinase